MENKELEEVKAQLDAKGKELDAVKKDLESKSAMLSEYTDHLKRLQAEFDNFAKRVDRERKAVIEGANEKLMLKLLSIVDDFERALPQLRQVPEEIRKGVELIFKNLHKVLEEERVQAIPTKGQMVDPYKHEVILKIESDEKEDCIVDEVQKGYMMNGKVIRYAKVTVSKGKPEGEHHG